MYGKGNIEDTINQMKNIMKNKIIYYNLTYTKLTIEVKF